MRWIKRNAFKAILKNQNTFDTFHPAVNLTFFRLSLFIRLPVYSQILVFTGCDIGKWPFLNLGGLDHGHAASRRDEKLRTQNPSCGKDPLAFISEALVSVCSSGGPSGSILIETATKGRLSDADAARGNILAMSPERCFNLTRSSMIEQDMRA